MANHLTCRFAAACIATIAFDPPRLPNTSGRPRRGRWSQFQHTTSRHRARGNHTRRSGVALRRHPGPAHWATLSPKFTACGEGAKPVTDRHCGAHAWRYEPLKTEFPPAELRIAHNAHVADGINNGHTIQINYAGEDRLTLGDVSYQLAQYHFHGPSEHTVGRQTFPDGNATWCIRRLMDGSPWSACSSRPDAITTFDPMWANLPAQQGVETHLPAVKVDALLPAVRTAYRYDGSLTTPPCSEGVKWIVMTTPIELSSEQIAAFTRLVKDNSRPVQPLNGRTVLTDTVKMSAAGQ